MKRMVPLVAFAFCAASVSVVVEAGQIDPGLEETLAVTPADESVSVLVYLRDRVDLEALNVRMDQERATLRDRHEAVVLALQEMAWNTQGDLVAVLETREETGGLYFFEPFWIANCIRVDATKEVIELLGAHPAVEMVYPNYPIENITPVGNPTGEGQPGDPRSRSPEIGLIAVRAPEVWALGFTGEGILVATLDTGVDGNHPALASRWRGVADPNYSENPEWAWFDPVTNTTFPQSFGSHGTHTMGTVCGGPPGDEIGVAPGAEWIHAAVIDRVSIEQTVADAILSFQWMLDPDEDPTTNWDVPEVCSNSWRVTTSHGYPPCDETFWTFLDACEAAGIVILFSAGNEGPGAGTVGRPPDRATTEYRTVAVGAVDGNNSSWPVAGFSSRGPSFCTPTGEIAIKPDLAAPGVDVRSSVPGGGYQSSGWSGTSMASPHVNGVVALMRQACPDISVQDVIQIMYDTAYDLGPPGEDNDYGYGMVDAYESVQIAMAMCSGPPMARDDYYETPVDTAVLITLDAIDYDGLPDPPGQLTYIVTSLPSPGNTLTDAGDDHLILEGDLPYTLVNYGNDLLFTPTGGFYGTDSFEFKVNDGGEPPDAGDSNIATVSILTLFDPPLITTEVVPGGMLNIPYGPFQLEATGGQPELTWAVLPSSVYTETDLGSSLFTEVGTAMGWNSDDASWSHTLPFAFPFYGVEYGSVSVCSNGFIDFTSSSADYTNTDSELIGATRIAVLWDDLKTNESGNDIFIDESVSGQVTIRWDAVTYSGSNPCDFSVVLFEDGLIQFHYGNGNTGLTPTIGISSGDGEHYLLASYNNASSLSNANSLEFVSSSMLPEGLAISTSGELSGTPTEAGVFDPIISVTDSLDRSDLKQFVLEIAIGPQPPTAVDGGMSTELNTPVSMVLVAVDDSLPNPPGQLDYIITALPGAGSLKDLGGGDITGAPYTLAGGGNQVEYTPGPWLFGPDTFQFKVNDGGVPPEGGDSNVATITVTVNAPPPQAAHSEGLESDPGWTTEGQWAFGQPAGGGSFNGDPSSGYTDNNVYGFNLGGDYDNNLPVYNLTTSAFDCSNVGATQLRFRRWLGVEARPNDHAAIEVSNDGANWTLLWRHAGPAINESSWSLQTYDISALADGQATVYIRWSMGPTNGSVTYPGWNIDDLEIWGELPACLSASGDVNLDGTIDGRDIDAFVDVLVDPESASLQEKCAADVQVDGVVNLEDTDDFVGLLLSL